MRAALNRLALTALVALAPMVADASPKKAKDQAPTAPPHESGAFCESYRVTNGPVVLFGIDRTIPSTDEFDRREIDKALSKVKGMLKEGWQVHAFTIRGDSSESQVVFSDCKPGTLADGWRVLTANPSDPVKVAHDQPQFEQLLTGSVKAVAGERMQRSDQSAIIATITAAARAHQGRVKALVLASDLIESQLEYLVPDPNKAIDTYTRNELLKKVQKGNLAPPLGSIPVEVFGVGQHDDSTKPKRPKLSLEAREGLAAFWEDYFRMTGASAITIHR